MSGLSTPPADTPRNTSAPSITSPSVLALDSCAYWILSSSISTVRPLNTRPSMSVTQMFDRGTPSSTSSCRQAIAAAPAPLTTSLQCASVLPMISSPLRIAAATMIAVPCWSS
jgi:hypothetical protein